MKRILFPVAILAAATLSVGCVSGGSYNKAMDLVKSERDMNAVYKQEIQRLEHNLKEADNERLELRKALKNSQAGSTTHKVDPSELDKTLQDLRNELSRDFDGWDLSSDNAIGTRLDDGSELLFRTGSWSLNTNAKTNLGKIATAIVKVLEAHPDYLVRVDGHTDSDPIKALRAKGINTNRHLSFMRANAVVEFLVSKGISEKSCIAMAHGEFRPVSDKKKLNRRVEIWVSTPAGFSIGPKVEK